MDIIREVYGWIESNKYSRDEYVLPLVVGVPEVPPVVVVFI